MAQVLTQRWENPENRAKIAQMLKEQREEPEFRDFMEMVYKARSTAFERHPEISETMEIVALDFPLLAKILSKQQAGEELNETEEKYHLEYFKECERRMPGYIKIIGAEQHRILVEWGLVEE